MCGITGIISSSKSPDFCKNLVQAALETTKHRGPDQSGIFSDKNQAYNFCFGANRLSIIDVGPSGNQPMYLDDLVIVYNGEVYNYLELKEELVKKGHRFLGGSDTEVILHAFKEWGAECVSKFIGMFSIAIFDKRRSKLYLIRDRLGEKPLYYYASRDIFIFSSELKGILIHDLIKKEFDQKATFNYFIFNSTSPPDTIFESIRQLCPGQIMEMDASSEEFVLKTSNYWELPELRPNYSLTEKRVLSDLTALIYNAVEIRLRSDVPVGIFLSGGIDSSLIAAIASQIHPQIKTFTIGYNDKKYDESGYANFVAKHLKVDHRVINLDEQSVDLDLEKVAYISDDCTANLSFVPFNALAQKTREEVKVALSGDGGDEFFCGYDASYKLINLFFNHKRVFKFLSQFFRVNKKARALGDMLSNADSLNVFTAQFLIRNKLSKIRDIFNYGHDQLEIYRRVNIQDKLRSYNLKPSFWNLSFYEAGGNYLTDTVLKTTDRASMYHGLEARPVLIDHRIIEYMASVPKSIILKNGTTKFLLKKMLSNYLPRNFVFNRPKRGFSVPLRSDYSCKWQKSIDKSVSILLGSKQDFLNKSRCKSIIEKKDIQDNELRSRLMFLLNFMKVWQVGG
jgi:asparagine synthase (glutamine-hydrolysing)